MRDVIETIESEYKRYKRLGEGALAQVTEEQLRTRPSDVSSSIATIVWHISGNLESRFTDFLTSDGEKEWRDREDEFTDRGCSAQEAVEKWERGWSVVFGTLASLDDSHLGTAVTIRGVAFTVAGALHRSLAHTSYHVGQMVYLGKMFAGEGWDYLSIPPGGTASYNANPMYEKGLEGLR